MKKMIIAVVLVLVLAFGGISVYAIKGLDDNNSRILAEDGYARASADAVGGEVTLSADIVKSVAQGAEYKGLHVTDSYAVFTMDNAFLKDLVAKMGKATEVTFDFAYNADKTAVTYLIKTDLVGSLFPVSGRCIGELPYTAATGTENILFMQNSKGKAIPLSAYYSDGNLMRWQVFANDTYTVNSKAVSFSDIKDHWGQPFIEFLGSRGGVSGMGNGTFVPNGTLNRAQFVQFLANISMDDLTAYSSSQFTDVKKSDWFYPAVSWAVANDITSGVSDTSFSPNANITRQQMTRFVENFCTYKGIAMTPVRTAADFADMASVSGWAKTSVATAYQIGIINGRGNNKFAPLENATRAESSTVCSRLISYSLILPQ